MDFKANIENLRGSVNWTKWKRQIELLLRHSDVHDIVVGERTLPVTTDSNVDETKVKKFRKDDALAHLILVSHMDDSNAELTATCDSSKSVWDKLLSIYEQSSGQRLDRLMEHFFQNDKISEDDIATHISKLQKNFCELNDELKRVASTTLPDLLLMSRIISTLPSEYFEFKSVWESVPIEERTVNKLTERLRLIEMRLPAKQSDSTAFLATKKKVYKKAERRCYVCRKPGHLAKNCNQKYQSKSKRDEVHGDAFICTIEGVPDSEIWLADSGASCHITKHKEYFVNYKPFSEPKEVYIGNNQSILAYGQGTIDVEMLINGKWENNYLEDVWFVPEISKNLFSIGQTIAKGFDFQASGNECCFKKNGVMRLKGVRTMHGLYALKMRVRYDKAAEVCVASTENSLQLWHERLCHQNKTHVKDVLKRYGIQAKQCEELCDGCMFGKQCRRPLGTRKNRPSSPGELIHSDVCGPMQQKSLGGAKYYVCFKDDYTKFRRVFFIKSKDEVSRCLQIFTNEAKNAGHVIKEFLSDGGTEYRNKDTETVLNNEGTTARVSMPYVPQQNGAAERENRTLVESARSMIHGRNLPTKLWAEAVNTAVYVLNRTGTTPVKGKSPYELWFQKEVKSINHLHIFGTECYVHIPKQKRKKWDKKSMKGIFVGYSGEKDGFRIWIKEQDKIVLSRDVVFDRETVKLEEVEKLVPDDKSKTEVVLKPDDQNLEQQNEEIGSCSPLDVSEEATGLQLRDRSKLKKPTKLNEYVLLAEYCEPETYTDALSSEYSEEWLGAMKEEISSLQENKTWELVDLPAGRKAIGCRWVFRIKNNSSGTVQRFKARLVAKGFSQKPGIDFSETFSPVVRWDTIRTVLSIAACEKLKLKQFDVKTAFLYGDLCEEIYMHQPEGFHDGTKKVCKLNKSIYGLKQAPRCWNTRFKQFAEACKLQQANSDPCLFLSSDKSLFLIVYVDDGIVAASSQQEIELFLDKLRAEFSVVIEEVSCFLGMQIDFLENGNIFIHQNSYCKKVINRFNMQECNSTSVPFEKGTITSDDASPLPAHVPYREAVGSLMFLAVVSRPDIAFTVGVLSQVLDKALQVHWNIVKKTIRYLKGTLKSGIMYQSNSKCSSLECYSDSDYAGDPITRRSTSGMVFRFSGGAITWKSQRQKCVSLSTTEAEFVAANQAAKEAVWLHNLLQELYHNVSVPVLQIDNQSAIKLIKNPAFHNKTKHIDIRYKFIRELYENNQLGISYCSSDDQAADLLTKALPKIRFEKLKELIGIVDLSD